MFELARKAMRVIHQNLFLALFFNLGGIALALTGKVNPGSAAAAILFSTALVMANSIRLNHTTGSLRLIGRRAFVVDAFLQPALFSSAWFILCKTQRINCPKNCAPQARAALPRTLSPLLKRCVILAT